MQTGRGGDQRLRACATGVYMTVKVRDGCAYSMNVREICVCVRACASVCVCERTQVDTASTHSVVCSPAETQPAVSCSNSPSLCGSAESLPPRPGPSPCPAAARGARRSFGARGGPHILRRGLGGGEESSQCAARLRKSADDTGPPPLPPGLYNGVTLSPRRSVPKTRVSERSGGPSRKQSQQHDYFPSHTDGQSPSRTGAPAEGWNGRPKLLNLSRVPSILPLSLSLSLSPRLRQCVSSALCAERVRESQPPDMLPTPSLPLLFRPAHFTGPAPVARLPVAQAAWEATVGTATLSPATTVHSLLAVPHTRTRTRTHTHTTGDLTATRKLSTFPLLHSHTHSTQNAAVTRK